MIDLIVFSVANNRYALNIDNVVRIIQATSLTAVPNSHRLIDGIMSYEENVLKVLNFRKLLKIKPHKEDLDEPNNPNDYEQKLIFFVNNDVTFAVKVDAIDDIAHVEEDDIMISEDGHDLSEFLDVSGVLDLDGVLINVISELRLPK